jgi:PhnB protein
MQDYKPAGYTSVAPYLIAAGAQQVIDFLKQAFGATELRRYDTEDGEIIHAEVRVDDTVIMLGEAGAEWPAVPTHMHVYVPDVHAAYRKCLAAGARPVQEPKQNDGDPDTRGGVMDSAGNTWWIATQS